MALTETLAISETRKLRAIMSVMHITSYWLTTSWLVSPRNQLQVT